MNKPVIQALLEPAEQQDIDFRTKHYANDFFFMTL